MAKKENLKNFSIKSYLEHSQKDIKEKIKENPINYLKIINSNKKNQKNRFKEIWRNLNKFINKKIIIEKKESIYVYQQSDRKKKYTGIICGVSTNDYNNRKIKIHEKTIEKRENLFKDYLKICKIHAEPVLLTYKDNQQANKFIQNKVKQKPLIKFTTNDKKTHSIWLIDTKKETLEIKKYFKKTDLYIADGHHRMSSSLLYNEEHNLNNQCLAYIIAADQLKLESFHRIISNVTTQQKKELLKFLDKEFTLKKGKENVSIKKNKINIYVSKKWYNITLKPTSEKIAVQILSDDILKPFFKIKDIRKSKKIKFIPDSKFKLYKIAKKNNIIFCLPGVKIEDIFQTSDKDKTMPPKSTYIRPKLRTGLIMMKLK